MNWLICRTDLWGLFSFLSNYLCFLFQVVRLSVYCKFLLLFNVLGLDSYFSSIEFSVTRLMKNGGKKKKKFSLYLWVHWMILKSWNAAGRDIGVTLPILLNAIVSELPPDGGTMLRIGMTNPPYILEHLKEMAVVLRHPCVYSFLHVPVQSGSDAILSVSTKSKTITIFFLMKKCNIAYS